MGDDHFKTIDTIIIVSCTQHSTCHNLNECGLQLDVLCSAAQIVSESDKI